MWIMITAMLAAGQTPSAAAHLVPPQDATVAPAADELQESYEALLDEYDSAKEAHYEAESDARKAHVDAGGSRRDFKRLPAIEGEFYPKFQAIADGGYAPAGVWCLSNHSYSGLKGDAAKADKLQRYDSIIDSKPGDNVFFALFKPLNKDTHGKEPLLNKKAAFAMLDKISAQSTRGALKARTLEEKAAILNQRGATAEQTAEAVILYKEIIEKYPESMSAGRCKGPLFVAENLQIGMKAPDIVGKDHNDKDIKLSDFSGKVTVIDFWGFW